jgi:RNA polymerase sigma-70 factor, ECF subfamily
MDPLTILARARAGEADAVQRIVMEEQRVVRSYLARLTPDPALVDDLAQEVFLAAFRSLDRVDDERGIRGYLLGIARNLARNAWRETAQRREVGGDAIFAMLAARPQPDGHEEDQRLEALRRCLKHLAPRAAKVLDLHYRDGLSCDAIAAVVATGASSVRATLARARAALLQCLAAPRGRA